MANWTFTNITLSEDALKPLSRSCFRSKGIDQECVIREFCPQLHSYYIRTGLIIIIVYVIVSWLLWWFFKHGYKKFKYDKTSRFGKFIGDLDRRETRIYWDAWVRTRLTKLCLGYIVVVVWLNRK